MTTFSNKDIQELFSVEGGSIRTFCQKYNISAKQALQALNGIGCVQMGQKSDVLILLTAFREIGEVMVIVEHLGSVFEYKGDFPEGAEGYGYYNLQLAPSGFSGHLNLEKITEVASVAETAKSNRQSYSWWFLHENGEVIFKVFVGRDEQGQLLDSQIKFFKQWKF